MRPAGILVLFCYSLFIRYVFVLPRTTAVLSVSFFDDGRNNRGRKRWHPARRAWLVLGTSKRKKKKSKYLAAIHILSFCEGRWAPKGEMRSPTLGFMRILLVVSSGQSLLNVMRINGKYDVNFYICNGRWGKGSMFLTGCCDWDGISLLLSPWYYVKDTCPCHWYRNSVSVRCLFYRWLSIPQSE